MLTPLPFLEGTLRLTQLPLLNGAVLVVESEVPAGEPPLDRSTQRRPLTPAVRVAIAFAVARVVDSLQEAPRHGPERSATARQAEQPALFKLAHYRSEKKAQQNA